MVSCGESVYCSKCGQEFAWYEITRAGLKRLQSGRCQCGGRHQIKVGPHVEILDPDQQETGLAGNEPGREE